MLQFTFFVNLVELLVVLFEYHRVFLRSESLLLWLLLLKDLGRLDSRLRDPHGWVDDNLVCIFSDDGLFLHFDQLTFKVECNFVVFLDSWSTLPSVVQLRVSLMQIIVVLCQNAQHTGDLLDFFGEVVRLLFDDLLRVLPELDQVVQFGLHGLPLLFLFL